MTTRSEGGHNSHCSRFDAEVVDYVQKRRQFEDKDIKLLRYQVSADGKLQLLPI